MTKDKKMKKWDGFDFYNNMSYDNPPREGTDASDECKQFRKEFRAFLKKALAPYGWTLVKRKPNYFDITEVVTDGTHYAYVSIGDVRWPMGGSVCRQILYRTMEHAEDWHGGMNHYCDIDDLAEKIVSLF